MKRPPITIIVLSLVAGVGLLAQFIAARAAFSLISSDPWQPFCAALLIEAAIVADALATARTRNEIALGGLVLALLASGLYNYAVAHAALPHLHLAVKLALSIGPVLALGSIGLALGEEVWRFEDQRAQGRQEQADVQAQIDAERRRFEQAEDAKDREHARKERRRERLHRQRTEGGQAVSIVRQAATPTNSKTAWENKASFLADTDRPQKLTPRRLADMTGQSKRNARRWLADAKTQSTNGRD